MGSASAANMVLVVGVTDNEVARWVLKARPDLSDTLMSPEGSRWLRRTLSEIRSNLAVGEML